MLTGRRIKVRTVHAILIEYMAKKFPVHPANPERICWGCDKFCAADSMDCNNERALHPAELFGPDWKEWGERPASTEVPPKDACVPTGTMIKP